MTVTLLPIDSQRTLFGGSPLLSGAFTPYGHCAQAGPLQTGYAGERLDTASETYRLGQGRRAYRPALMRFTSVDSYSPFGVGGLNGYAYCRNDPINHVDPSGNAPLRQLPTAGGASSPLAKHYAARSANFTGSLAAAAMSFTNIAVEHMQLQLEQPNARFSPGHRARRIAGFHAMSNAFAADGIEMFLPPESADRATLVDNLGLASAGFFTAEAVIALTSTIQTEGVRGILPTAQSLVYAAGEVTLIGPAKDLVHHVIQSVYNNLQPRITAWRNRGGTPAVTAYEIRNPDSPEETHL